MRVLCLFAATLVVFPLSSLAQKKEIVELQRDIALLQDQVRTLQRSMDEKLAAITVLVQQNLDSANKANTAVAVLESGIRDRLREQEKTVAAPVAGVGAKVDQLTEEFRGVKESVADLSARMGKLQSQIVDVSNAIKVMQAPPAPPSSAPAGGAGSPPPSGVSADSLYDNAMRDRSSGNLDLALQEFSQFLQFFPATDRAPNAQFYIGMIYYDQGDMNNALKAFDLVLEKFPDNSKTPDALYMKGQALVKMGQRTAAAKEFRAILERHPRSDVAEKARDQLKKLGYSTSSTGKSTAAKKRR